MLKKCVRFFTGDADKSNDVILIGRQARTFPLRKTYKLEHGVFIKFFIKSAGSVNRRPTDTSYKMKKFFY